MKYRSLGRSGMKVSTLCVGGQYFGRAGVTGNDEAERIIGTALDAGVNFIDTADVYGASEEIIGDCLKRSGRRDDVVIGTKFGVKGMGSDPNSKGGSRRWMIRAVEGSLRRLQTDYIDLYQYYRPDKATDIDETLSALSDLVSSGKVRVVGCSTFPPEMIVEAQWSSQRDGYVRFRSEQSPYSIFARAGEAHQFATCERYGMGVIAWGALNGGWLSGGYRPGRPFPALSRAARNGVDPEHPGVRRKLELVAELTKLADENGLSLPAIAVAFVLEHPAVSSAIVGARTVEQFQQVLAGADVRLSPAVLDRIDELVPAGTNVDASPGASLSSNRGDMGFTAEPIREVSLRRRPRF
ncbi:aldo/keto reductase [Nonomuraea angiospora]|uniref:Aryl-alcohol dehydrogenase-like predicted oxidoreductase n=1 Tax=Nonomuraea angiospora TaxID=46172 RepID=A0ABR9LNW7_9ACTN|nr:aldo/keto reductase [Nonomuraea angiospora]MBE1582302.1 aryl-alcohol dehydrogenase-like predicted oxidoreductase [Nonomuraea angiospora]